MRGIQRLLALSFCVVGAVSLSLAQGQKPWNHEGKNKWGMGGDIYITGFTANNEKVSGTNVNFAFYVDAGVATDWDPPVPPPPGTHPYNRVRITSVTMKIGGTPVYTGSGASSPGATDSVWKAVRYASTNFADDSDIELELNATFELSCVPDGQPGTIPPPCTLVFEPLKIKNKAYNKGLSWATHEEVNQQTQQLEYIANPTLPQYCAAAYIGAKQAWDYLKNSMNHQDMFPANKDNTNIQLEPDIAAPLKTKTFVFGFTHGWSTGVTASYDGSPAPGHNDTLTWAEVAGYVAGVSPNLRTAPPINMVIMYACSTCAGGSSAASDAFGTTAGGVKIDNRAYLGFDDTVWSVVDKRNPQGGLYPLSHHSNLLMAKLSAGGWTIAEARDAADLRYRPVVDNNEDSETVTIIKGDDHARMINVYIGTKEGTIAERHSWYKVF